MDLFDAVKGRRSIRMFKPEPVPREKLMMALDAARWAPSAGNCQPWVFIIVEDASAKRELAEAALGQVFIAEAPVVVVVCADMERSAARYGERGRRFYCLLDAAAATQNLLLAAHALGLGACWVGAFHDQRVADRLMLPPSIRAIAIVPIGVPAEQRIPVGRRPLEESLHYGKYQRSS
ncbi:MAG: nitroreductase family protein [Candidatus Bathyarchaeia archaeon]